MLNISKCYFFIGLIATCSILVSCGEDGDKNPNSVIAGTWNYDSNTFKGTINGQEVVPFLMANLGLSQQEAQFYQAFVVGAFVNEQGFDGSSIEFNEDGTFIRRQNGTQVDSGTYLLQNNNSKLILTSGDGVQEFDIKELTNNKLVLIFSGEQKQDVTNDGVLETIDFTFELTFIK